MTWVAGVDGCRAGWVVVLVNKRKAQAYKPHIKVCASFEEVLAVSPRPTAMAVDVPIGLLDNPRRGGRECDIEARRLLGRRASSVFSPPSRLVLNATRYAQVRGKGLSCQAFNILPKVREVDRLMTPKLQRRVYEAHPELAFRALAGRPMGFNKKTAQGRRERLNAIKKSWPELLGLFRGKWKSLPRTQVALDDLLDACILAHTASRIARNRAVRVPPHPPVDRKGLRMEMWR